MYDSLRRPCEHIDKSCMNQALNSVILLSTQENIAHMLVLCMPCASRFTNHKRASTLLEAHARTVLFCLGPFDECLFVADGLFAKVVIGIRSLGGRPASPRRRSLGSAKTLRIESCSTEATCMVAALYAVLCTTCEACVRAFSAAIDLRRPDHLAHEKVSDTVQRACIDAGQTVVVCTDTVTLAQPFTIVLISRAIEIRGRCPSYATELRLQVISGSQEGRIVVVMKAPLEVFTKWNHERCRIG